MNRVVGATFPMRIVLTVAGPAREAPKTDAERGQFCSYVRDALTRYPLINDVTIWNEVNSNDFWQPQFANGESVGAGRVRPAARALLRHAEAARVPGVNLMTDTSPRGNDNPYAVSNASHSPGLFVRKLGEAYRAMGREPAALRQRRPPSVRRLLAREPLRETPEHRVDRAGRLRQARAGVRPGVRRHRPADDRRRCSHLLPRGRVRDDDRLDEALALQRRRARPHRRVGSAARGAARRRRALCVLPALRRLVLQLPARPTRGGSPGGSRACSGRTARRSPPTRRCAA